MAPILSPLPLLWWPALAPGSAGKAAGLGANSFFASPGSSELMQGDKLSIPSLQGTACSPFPLGPGEPCWLGHGDAVYRVLGAARLLLSPCCASSLGAERWSGRVGGCCGEDLIPCDSSVCPVGLGHSLETPRFDLALQWATVSYRGAGDAQTRQPKSPVGAADPAPVA